MFVKSNLLVAFLGVLVPLSLAGNTDDYCYDNPYYFWRGKDCEEIADAGKCEVVLDNGDVVGEVYCPVSCDKCYDEYEESSLTVTKDCFEYGEDIVAHFVNVDPHETDAVAIWPYDEKHPEHYSTDPKLWKWLCYGDDLDLGKNCKAYYGEVVMNGDATGTWPLPEGEDYIMILKKAGPNEMIKASDVFYIGDCGHPGPAPTPSPVKPVPAPTKPTRSPVSKPTRKPTPSPTKEPTRKPTPSPTKKPTRKPTPSPSKEPTKKPTPSPTKEPTKKPTPSPSKEPTKKPTPSPSKEPTKKPTPSPSKEPTKKPTPSPSKEPTKEPTKSPTKEPTKKPTPSPTKYPTAKPVPHPGCYDEIYTEYDCYGKGEAITVYFYQCDPEHEDWIGIWDSDEDSDDLPAEYYPWQNLCGGQHCSDAVKEGHLVFKDGSYGPWPLPPGEYKFHMLREGDVPYESYAETLFVVKDDEEDCYDYAYPTP